MKKIRLTLILFLAIAGTIVMPSCKKGDGDPFFSIYSRSARLCGEWKIASYTKTVTSGTKTWITAISGNQKIYTTQIDTTMVLLVPTPHDSTFKMETKHTWTGNVEVTFLKDGTYDILENFKDDSSSMAWTAEEKGKWYFMSGNKELGYKNKELLGLQQTSYVYNPDAGTSYSSHYQGNSETYVYEIYALKNKEVIFKAVSEETVNSVKTNMTMEMTLQPR